MAADPTLLRSIPLFQNMDDGELAALAAITAEERFAKGAQLFREHDPGGVLFVIRRGEIELSVRQSDGKKVVVDRLGPGEFFGEMSLLDGGSRSTTAIALSPADLLRIDRRDFLDVLRRQPEAAIDVMAALAVRIRRTNDLIRQLPNPNQAVEERETLGDRIADGVARFGGSWSFLLSFFAGLLCWVLLNGPLGQHLGRPAFDPYPFILLNLFLSMLAAVQAPVIMMSQNRQDQKDRIRSELDYQINVKAESEIMELHDKVDRLLALSEHRGPCLGAGEDQVSDAAAAPRAGEVRPIPTP